RGAAPQRLPRAAPQPRARRRPVKKVPYSKNREAIHDLLTRAKRYHCNSHSVHELDAEPLLSALRLRREAGRPVRFHAYLVKATSLLMKRFPRLNHHLFHTPLGK